MLFPKLTFEKTVQIYDKLRLDASLTFAVGGDEVTEIEIKPSVTDDYYSVYNSNPDKWYLDWAYSADGIAEISVRVTHTSGSTIKTFETQVLDEADDALFSDDNDLFPHEPNILEYLPKGKSSFLYAHREAQSKILDYLDAKRIWKTDGERYLKADIASITDDEIRDQFKRWSTYQTLVTILESIQVSTDDIFQEKKLEYSRQLELAKSRAALRLDQDGDGIIDEYRIDVKSLSMRRV